MRMGWLLALALAGRAYAMDVASTVDASLRELRTAAIQTISFRDPVHGLITDGAGGAFESSDGGDTWTKIDIHARGVPTADRMSVDSADPSIMSMIDAVLWADAQVGVAHVFGDPHAYRTVDGGTTWKPVLLPSAAFSNVVIAVGRDIWICGDAFSHSSDFGESWSAVPSPFGDVSCGDVSFADSKHGWASSRDDALAATDDGGQSWHPLTPPRKGRWALWRTSPSDGWIGTDKALYRTTDGGAHFARVKPVVMDPVRGPHLVKIGEQSIWSASSERLAPLSPHDHVRVDDDRVIDWAWPASLVVFDHGTRFPTVPLTRVGPPTREALIASRTFEAGATTGVSSKHAYHSVDGGLHWFAVGDLPGEPKRVAFIDWREIILETTEGLFFSGNGGRDWEPSANPAWDRFELERALGGKAVSPLACVGDSNEGTLTVSYGWQGCFGGQHRDLVLAWHDGKATLQGASISRAKAKEIARRFADAASMVENPPDGFSSSREHAKLTWSCGGVAQSLEVSAMQEEQTKDTEELAWQKSHYMRANGVTKVADALLGPWPKTP